MNIELNKKILIVDDESIFRQELKNSLLELGFKPSYIIEADNGKSALAILKNNYTGFTKGFDIIFCDWNMPSMNGIDLLKKIRKSEEGFCNTPFILVTTVSEKDKVIHAIKHDLSGYIIKPVALASIEKTLKSVFSK